MTDQERIEQAADDCIRGLSFGIKASPSDKMIFESGVQFGRLNERQLSTTKNEVESIRLREALEQCRWQRDQERSELSKKEEEINRLKGIVNEIWDMFYGQNFQIIGWHLNGAPEPINTFFENNDWKVDLNSLNHMTPKKMPLLNAIKFYADKSNWRTNSGKIGITPLTDGSDAELIDGHWTNGKLARQAVADYDAREKGE